MVKQLKIVETTVAEKIYMDAQNDEKYSTESRIRQVPTRDRNRRKSGRQYIVRNMTINRPVIANGMCERK